MSRRRATPGLAPLALAAAAALGLAACATAPRRSETYGARKGLAQELLRRGDLPGAFSLVDGLHREDPKDAEVLVMRGVIYRDQRMAREAEADLQEALALRPGFAHAHSSLAIAYDQDGRGREALEHHRQAADLERANPAYLNNLGFALLAQGRPREAVPVLHEALRLDPTSPRVHNNLGFAYARAGEWGKASQQFALGGTPAESKNNLGFAYQSAGNLAQAFDLFVEALRLDPALARARQNLREVSRRLERAIPADVATEPRT